MKHSLIHKTLIPIYIYYSIFAIFYLTIGDINSDFWSNLFVISVLFIIPFIVLLSVNIQLVNIQSAWWNSFLLSILCGLLPSLWIGYGTYGILFSPTPLGFVQALSFFGIFGGTAFGLLGLFFYFVLKMLLKKLTKK